MNCNDLLSAVKVGRSALLRCIAALALFAAAAWANDVADIVGHLECAECHEKSEVVWKKTTHFSLLKEMHRTKEAKAIAKKMGIKRIKSKDSVCTDCHYTMKLKSGKPKVFAGVSCESCHGAAANWLSLHSEFSGKEEKDETPEEEAKRWTESEAAGMIRPSNLYALASNCVSCHLVADSELVDVGGHPAGSDFELVSWSQGEVRHNVWYTESNDEASAERKRMLFVMGMVVELEKVAAALAAAPPEGMYAQKMSERFAVLRDSVKQAASAAPEINAIWQAIDGVDVKDTAALSAAAAVIAENAKALGRADGSGLAAVDALLPAASEYKGAVHP